jgi:uncharacterized protein (TIGR00369 family)
VTAALTREALERMIAGCPHHRWLGLRLDAFDQAAGEITVSLAARAEFSRAEGRVELHGGILATLIDIAGDYAVALKVGRGVPTIGLHVDYLRLARGARASAQARVVKCGRSIAVVDIAAHDDTGTLVAVGRASYSTA